MAASSWCLSTSGAYAKINHFLTLITFYPFEILWWVVLNPASTTTDGSSLMHGPSMAFSWAGRTLTWLLQERRAPERLSTCDTLWTVSLMFVLATSAFQTSRVLVLYCWKCSGHLAFLLTSMQNWPFKQVKDYINIYILFQLYSCIISRRVWIILT